MEPVDGGARLRIRLTPKSSADRIDGISQDADGTPHLRAKVTAVPEKGKANAALAKLLSKKLGLPKSAITIIAGEQSRQKTVHLQGDTGTITTKVDNCLKMLGITER